MSLRGRRRSSWVITTYCDYGVLNRSDIFCRHYSEIAAQRAWKKYITYLNAGWRIWQKKRGSDEIINSTPVYGCKTYGPAR